MDPGARVAFAVLEAEGTRGTDGAVVIDSATNVHFRRVHELKDLVPQPILDEVDDALTEYPGYAIVLDRRMTGLCAVWRIPKREMTQLFGTSALLMPEAHRDKNLPVWTLMTRIGTLQASLRT